MKIKLTLTKVCEIDLAKDRDFCETIIEHLEATEAGADAINDSVSVRCAIREILLDDIEEILPALDITAYDFDIEVTS